MEKLDQIILEESKSITKRRELFSACYNRAKAEGLDVTYTQVQKRVPELLGKASAAKADAASTPLNKVNPHRTIFS